MLPVVRWAFYGFVFSLLFEYPDRTIPVEIPTLTGAVFLAISLCQPGICYRRPPREFWWFATFLFVLIVAGSYSAHQEKALGLIVLMIQIMLLFWAGYNLMRYEKIANAALAALAAGSTAVAIMMVTGYQRTKIYDHYAGGERFAVLGQNPNNMANNVALGLFALLGLVYFRKSSKKLRCLVIPVFAMMGYTIMMSGSRGAVVAAGIGLLAFTVQGKTLWQKIGNTILVVMTIGLLFVFLTEAPTMKARSRRTVQEGNMAGREDIFPAAWQMFSERPITGWGLADNMYELGKRAPIQRAAHPEGDRDTHNVYLEVLTSTGLIGAVPLFTGMFLCLASAWAGRGGSQGILPLAMVLTVLAINGSGNWLASKLDWLMLAYAAATARPLVAARIASAAARLKASTRLLRGARPPRLRNAAMFKRENGKTVGLAGPTARL